jgi:hypothetical protein
MSYHCQHCHLPHPLRHPILSFGQILSLFDHLPHLFDL